jgi:hypothetical protein
MAGLRKQEDGTQSFERTPDQNQREKDMHQGMNLSAASSARNTSTIVFLDSG